MMILMMMMMTMTMTKTMTMTMTMVLEDLHSSKAGLGDLLVLVEQVPPDVEDVVLRVRWSNFHSFRRDI